MSARTGSPSATLLDGVPQIRRLGIGVLVGGEIAAHALPEALHAEVLLQHAKDVAALQVREDVEHRLCLVRTADGKLDRPRRVEGVDLEGCVLLAPEAHPPPPLRPEVVEAADAHEGGERLVQPDAVPPLHRDEVAEPHVGDLVLDHLGDPRQLGDRGGVLVAEQVRLPERHAAEVLHRSLGEVRHVDEVELRSRIGQSEVLRVPAERVHGDLEGERGEVLLADRGDHPDRRAAGVGGLGRFERVRRRSRRDRSTWGWCRRTARDAGRPRGPSRSARPRWRRRRGRPATSRAIEKTAFRSGSSKHGKARRASWDSKWVVASVCVLPPGSVNVLR